ncbi:alpha-D-xyloside xylohydrolase [Parabacteroides sp. PF5-5]|uniref:TIM-barrel domain-containing protein n=1 Tax=unclassified Parabacteroides TaxID=2649774 RepID=UPI002475AA4D|nr:MULTISPECIES: TIM-barrel domain-containing protein [unclassified Parabacteroides]MDH6303426.1 alpha-D-xyloside xylohydrolase [Parabacteroides sp. PH5-39]MDH6314749.1 alpha-D-xyloside xylohydrolase [Parabacteroides sp. PF5-13]MDH6318086.1 alpha-D-xyloside xylohydrolase [Parabacteroides sp. PH5-13]MDH6321983.1 alpha-D-xyloside xylohydrolase [Parabacteroides sp. PH5-8]MDH6326106.1 alpha-D-xyloside xylohydrolase [Parabacteroides sp. PH5-41]
MKQFFLSTLAVFLLLCSCQQSYQKTTNGLIAPIQNGEAKAIKLEVISDDVIHVLASPTGEFVEEVNMIKTTQPLPTPSFNINQNGDTLILSTANIQACLSQRTGEVWFTDKNGNMILREKQGGGKEFQAMEIEGVKGYTLRQIFEGSEDEGLYGLGQHQSDEFNYKGKNEELFQYNTKVSVPFIMSTKGYGILWHNYSLSRFGDKRPYSDLPETFKIYDKARNEGWITASYYSDKAGKDLLISRNERKIDYEDLVSIKNFPDNFPRNNAYATWEGEIEAKESGKHHFKLHYAGYTKVFIDGKEVVPERWRTAWNPNDYKFAVNMEKGKRYPLRIEWLPDGGVSYLGLKVLSPVPEVEQKQVAFFSEMGDEIDYYFINGETMDDVISGYRNVTGKSQIMPKWAMGYWLSRERYKTQDELLTALGEYRKQQVPLDVIVQDWSYWPVDAWGSHEFDEERFPDPAGMVKNIHDQQARIMISVWPKFYITTEHYKELDAIGAMYQQAVQDSIRDWIYPGYIGSFYDAYHPEARKIFWKQMNEHLYKLGIDAWWMDASEPNVQDNTDMDYRKKLCGPTYLGPSTKYFNAYALANAEAIYDGQRGVNPDDRVFLLTRSGFAGVQRYSTATWSGDIGTRWEDMKAQISAGLNFAMSGIPYWTMDIGGFCVENRYSASNVNNEDMNEWRELNTRWFQFGAFCPLFRSHGQYPYREIYHIAPQGTPTYNSIKYYTELRYQLMPYIYSLAGMTYFNDYTIMRALVMDYTEDRKTYDIGDQFMFGPSFMACPVYTYKDRSREVYFPSGLWYDFYSGKSIHGGVTKHVEAPYERMPLYVKAGSIVPTGKVIQSTAERQENLTIYVYAGKDGRFTLYEDNGVTYDYEKGNYSTIDLHYNEAGKKLIVNKRKGNFPEMIEKRSISVIFITPDNPLGKKFDTTYTGEQIEISLS